MSRLFVAASMGLALMAGILGCSGEQGASVAPSTTQAPTDASVDQAKGKTKFAGEKPTVGVSPVQ